MLIPAGYTVTERAQMLGHSPETNLKYYSICPKKTDDNNRALISRMRAFEDSGNQVGNQICGRRGEAEIENGPVDHFPAEPTEESFSSPRYEPRGFGASAGSQKRMDSFLAIHPLLTSCGRWDLNPHDVTITRSLVLLVYQFRHFRATMVYYHLAD